MSSQETAFIEMIESSLEKTFPASKGTLHPHVRYFTDTDQTYTFVDYEDKVAYPPGRSAIIINISKGKIHPDEKIADRAGFVSRAPEYIRYLLNLLEERDAIMRDMQVDSIAFQRGLLEGLKRAAKTIDVSIYGGTIQGRIDVLEEAKNAINNMMGDIASVLGEYGG